MTPPAGPIRQPDQAIPCQSRSADLMLHQAPLRAGPSNCHISAFFEAGQQASSTSSGLILCRDALKQRRVLQPRIPRHALGRRSRRHFTTAVECRCREGTSSKGALPSRPFLTASRLPAVLSNRFINANVGYRALGLCHISRVIRNASSMCRPGCGMQRWSLVGRVQRTGGVLRRDKVSRGYSNPHATYLWKSGTEGGPEAPSL